MTRTFTLTLDEETARRLDAASQAEGLSVDAFVARLIEQHLTPTGLSEDPAVFEAADHRTDAARQWQREQADIAFAEYDRTGVSISLEDALKAFRTHVEDGLAAKGRP